MQFRPAKLLNFAVCMYDLRALQTLTLVLRSIYEKNYPGNLKHRSCLSPVCLFEVREHEQQQCEFIHYRNEIDGHSWNFDRFNRRGR